MRPLALGFIGLGRAATRLHLPPLQRMVDEGAVELAAFCDSSIETAREAARTFGAGRVYDDHRAMLDAERLEALLVCIPPTLHTDAELLAAERGIALFVEKPQTLDLGQAIRYDDAIRRAGIVTQIGFHHRYLEAAARMRSLLTERTPRHVLAHQLYSGAPVIYWTSRFELCGGSFVEHGIHTVDLLRFWLGDIASVAAFYVDRRPGEGPEPMNLPHVYNVSYRFVSGTTANVTMSRVLTKVDYRRAETLVVADDALLEWTPKTIVENGETIWSTAAEPDPDGPQMRAFIDAVRCGDPGTVLSPSADALQSLAAVLAANESAARGGALVHVDEFIERARRSGMP